MISVQDDPAHIISFFDDLYQNMDGIDVAYKRGQFLSTAITHGHTELKERLFADPAYTSLVANYPHLPEMALDAGDVILVERLLRLDAPVTWMKLYEWPYERNESWYYFRSAVQCACFRNLPDLLKRLVAYYLSHRYDSMLIDNLHTNIIPTLNLYFAFWYHPM